jgi:hypothetical protein
LPAIAIPAIWLARVDNGTLTWLTLGKRRWQECYLKTEDINGCNAATNFMVHPNPQAVQMKEKMEFLKLHHLNIYSDNP